MLIMLIMLIVIGGGPKVPKMINTTNISPVLATFSKKAINMINISPCFERFFQQSAPNSEMLIMLIDLGPFCSPPVHPFSKSPKNN